MRKFMCAALAVLTLTAFAGESQAWAPVGGAAFRAARLARLGVNRTARIGLNAAGLVRNREFFLQQRLLREQLLLSQQRLIGLGGYGIGAGFNSFAAGYGAQILLQQPPVVVQPPPVVIQQPPVVLQQPPTVIQQQEFLQGATGGCAGINAFSGGVGLTGVDGYGLGTEELLLQQRLRGGGRGGLYGRGLGIDPRFRGPVVNPLLRNFRRF